MRTNLSIFYALFSAALSCACASAQLGSAEQFPITGISDDSTVENQYYAVRRAVGARIPEMLPSAQDNDGHWGSPANGLQLSIRFRKTEFLQGEPVRAISILRNLTAEPLTLFVTNGPGYYGGVAFAAQYGSTLLPISPAERARFPTNSVNDPDPMMSRPIPFVGLLPQTLAAKSEIAVVVNVSQLFNLNEKGDYSVQASFPVFLARSNSPVARISTDTASFRVVDKLSPKGTAERIAWDEEMQQLQQKYNKVLSGNDRTNAPGK